MKGYLKSLTKNYLYILACLIFSIVCILYILQVKLFNDQYIRNTLAEIKPSLRVLSESAQLGYHDLFLELSTQLQSHYHINSIEINTLEQTSCIFPKYQVNGFTLCWHGNAITVFKKIDYMLSNKILNLVFETQYLDKDIIGMIGLLVLLFLLCSVVLANRSFLHMKRTLVTPLMQLNKSLLNKKPFDYTGKITEINTLAKVIKISQEKIHYRLHYDGLRSIAHDLKKPTYYTYSFIKRFNTLKSSKRKSYVNKNLKLLNSHLRLSNLTLENIFDVGLEPVLHKKYVNLIEVFKLISNFFADDLNVIYPKDPLCQLHVDTNKLIRALNNLIINAIEASNNVSNSEVVFGCDHKANEIMFWVLNTQRSLSYQELLNISHPENRIHGGASEGLGLHIAHTFIAAHQGRIVFESAGRRSDGAMANELNGLYVKCEIYLPNRKTG